MQGHLIAHRTGPYDRVIRVGLQDCRFKNTDAFDKHAVVFHQLQISIMACGGTW